MFLFSIKQPISYFPYTFTLKNITLYFGFISETSRSTYNLKQIQDELKESYRQKRSKLPFLPGVPDHCRSMKNLFVELELEEPVEGDRFRTRTLNSCGEVAHLKDKSGNRLNRILVKGNPGIGKTSLISKLAYDWASDPSKSKSEYDLVLVIDLRKIKPGHGLLESVQDQLLTQVSLSDLSVCTSPNHSVLWLFDGYDEAPTDFLDGNCGDLKDIWESSALLNHCVIVTTRPNKVTDFIQKYGKMGQYNHVRVTGFPEKKMQVNYVSKHFSLNHFYQWLLPLLFMVIPRGLGYSVIQRSIKYMFGQAIDLLLQLNNSPRVKQLSQFPLFLSMLCVVWEEKNELPKSVTSLYKDLIMYLAKFGDDKFQSETSLENVHQILLGTGEIALKGLFIRQFEFSATEDNEYLSDAYKLGVLVKEGAKLSFLHKTFQELCAAVFWASLAEDNEDKFKEYLKKIDTSNYEDMEYLLRLCCGADTKAASLILDHCVHLMGDVLTHSQADQDSDLCLFGVGSLKKKVVNPWRLPLSLLFEAESHGSAESLQDQLKPIVKMIRMHNGWKIPDQEMKIISEYYIHKYNSGSSKTWLLFVSEAVCTFHSAVKIDGICVSLLHSLPKLRILHINGYTSLFSPSWTSACDFSSLVRELKAFPAIHTMLTELKITRCSINIIELVALLYALPMSCQVKLSIVKVFQNSTQELAHISTNSVGPKVLHLEGDKNSSDFNVLFKALTLYPSLRKSLKEFHCLRLQLKKSILCDYFAHLSSIPERMSFQQVEVGGTSSAPEHLVRYELGKLTISGTGAPGYFDCTTWVECFTSCCISANSLSEFQCTDCFVNVGALQSFLMKYTNIHSLQLHLFKPSGTWERDFELHFDNGEMTMQSLHDISKWLKCINTCCSARNTLQKLLCGFGSVKTNELLHFCSQQKSLTSIYVHGVKLTQSSKAAILDATKLVSIPNAFSFTQQNLKFCLCRCTIDCESLLNIISKSPEQLLLIEIYLTDTFPASGCDNLESYIQALEVSSDSKCYIDLTTALRKIREACLEDIEHMLEDMHKLEDFYNIFKDICNMLVQHDLATFSDCSRVLDVLAHVHMPSLKFLGFVCCKVTAQSLANFVCSRPLVQGCVLCSVTMTGRRAIQKLTLTASLRYISMVNCNVNAKLLVPLLSHHTWDLLVLYHTTISSTTDWFKTVFNECNGIAAKCVWICGENSPIPMISLAALVDKPTGTSKLYKDDDQKVVDVANTVFYNNYEIWNDHEGFIAFHFMWCEDQIKELFSWSLQYV